MFLKDKNSLFLILKKIQKFSKLVAKCRARINSNENVEKILKFMMTDNWNIKKLIDVFLLDDCSYFVYDHETVKFKLTITFIIIQNFLLIDCL